MASDEELMMAFRSGSADAFGELFRRYRQPVWGYFRRRLHDDASAEELTQDTFVAVVKGAARYEPRALFRTYLYSIAFNLMSAERRRTRRSEQETLDESAVAGKSSDPDAAIWVRRAVAQLDPSDREIVLLREYEALSYQEIADVLKIPLNTVRSRLFRARLELRRLLEPGMAMHGTLS